MLQIEIESLTGSNEMPASSYGWQDRRGENLPGVPVLTETLLKMEFELHESSTNLRGFSAAVLEDVGATIQILRLAGQEYGAAIDRPLRVEDCISDLGPRACLNAAAAGSLLDGNRQHAHLEMWAHSREVAQRFRLLAEQAPSRISPDQAYLAGLLHAMGALPAVLAWGRGGLSAHPPEAALSMAEQWHFPHFLQEFFAEILMPGYSREWANFTSLPYGSAQESWLRRPARRATILSFPYASSSTRRANRDAVDFDA